MMRDAFYILATAIWCGIVLVCCATTDSRESMETPKATIVATVNGSTITYAEYKQALDSTYQRFYEMGQLVDGSMYEQLKVEVLESLINLRLLYQHSQTLGIRIADEQVESYFERSVAKYPSRNAFIQSIETAGLTETDLKMRIRYTLGAQQFVETHIAPKVDVTDAEVRTYYEANPHEFEHDVQVHAAHILIKVSPWAEEQTKREAKRKILDIRAKILAGADFAEMAKRHSEGPSKTNGGDLGYFGGAQMAPAFETVAFSLKPGEVSDPVFTQFGYHLIKVYDRKPAGKQSLAEASPMIRSRFEKERLDRHLRQVVDQLKAEADIERFEP
jgi:peptidyl-prolyl cis-trans isomerase C